MAQLSPQLITLAGTVVGGTLGFLAPITVSRLGRHERSRDAQRATASAILELFESADSLTAGFGSRESPARRKLYLLALRIDDSAALDACLRFIAEVGGPPPVDEDAVADAWEQMIADVSRVYTGARRGGR